MNIKILRTGQKMTQAELAEKIGVDQTAVSQWETGQTYPKASLLPKIAEALNCTLDEMFKTSVDNQTA
jgi:transcriptional regulator with XRE-family HTH domain